MSPVWGGPVREGHYTGVCSPRVIKGDLHPEGSKRQSV